MTAGRPTSSWRAEFVGRALELATLLRRFEESAPELHRRARGASDDDCPRPRPSIVVLRGESGLGKSRIVQEFYRRIACSTDAAALPLDPEDYWPDAFGDPDASGKLVNPVIPENHTRGLIPPFLWWGVQWPEPAAGQSPSRAALLDGGYLDCLAAHQEGVSRKYAIALKVLGKAGSLALKTLSFGMVSGDLVLDAATESSRVGERLEAARRLLSGTDHATRVQERGQDRLRLVTDRLRAILRPAGLGPLHDASTPIILWLDDAQWMTPEEVFMLSGLWQEALTHDLPLMIVATHWESPWLADARRAVPFDADGRQKPDRFASFASRVAKDRLSILDVSADLDFTAPLKAALPGLTNEQREVILAKAHGHPLLFRLIVDHYRNRPRSFVDRNPDGPLSERAVADLESIAVDAALNTFARRKIRDLDDTVREVLGWSSVQGVRFLRQVTEEIARQELDTNEPVHAALDTAVDPEAIIQIAGSANQRAFRQHIFREIMLSDLGADRSHIEESVRRITHEWLQAPDLAQRLVGSELDDFLLLATSHLGPRSRAGAPIDPNRFNPSDPWHQTWFKASGLRLDRLIDGGQWSLTLESVQELAAVMEQLGDDDWLELAPGVSGSILRALSRGGRREDMQSFAERCEHRLVSRQAAEHDRLAVAIAIARLWRSLGFVHSNLGEPTRQLACFLASEKALRPFRTTNDPVVAYGIARSLHYQAHALQELDGGSKALETYRIVAGLWREILRNHPDHPRALECLGLTLNNIANCERATDPLRSAATSAEAIEIKKKALTFGGERADLIVSLMNGHGTHYITLQTIGEAQSASMELEEALRIADRLIIEYGSDANAIESAVHWLNIATQSAENRFDNREALGFSYRVASTGLDLLDRAGPTLKRLQATRSACRRTLSLAVHVGDAGCHEWAAAALDRVDSTILTAKAPSTRMVLLAAEVLLDRHALGRTNSGSSIETTRERILQALREGEGIEGRLQLLAAAESMALIMEEPCQESFDRSVEPVLRDTEEAIRESMASGLEPSTAPLFRVLHYRESMAKRRGDDTTRRAIQTEITAQLRELLRRESERGLAIRHVRDLADALWERSVDEDLPSESRHDAQQESIQLLRTHLLDSAPELKTMGEEELAEQSRMLETLVERLGQAGSEDIIEPFVRLYETDEELWKRRPDNPDTLEYVTLSASRVLQTIQISGNADLHHEVACAVAVRAISCLDDAARQPGVSGTIAAFHRLIETAALAAGVPLSAIGLNCDDPVSAIAERIADTLAAANDERGRTLLSQLAAFIAPEFSAITDLDRYEAWASSVASQLDHDHEQTVSTADSCRMAIERADSLILVMTLANDRARTLAGFDRKIGLLRQLLRLTSDGTIEAEMTSAEEARAAFDRDSGNRPRHDPG
ncbi:MAG: hypothetical protein RLZZ461_9 [Planctomycetota bacterium]